MLATAIGLNDLTSVVIVVVTIPLIPVFMALIGWRTEAAVAKRFKVATRLANHFADLVAGLRPCRSSDEPALNSRAAPHRGGQPLRNDAHPAHQLPVLFRT